MAKESLIKLVRILMHGNYSKDTPARIFDPMLSLTEHQKEMRASQILSVMESVDNEEELLQKLKELKLL